MFSPRRGATRVHQADVVRKRAFKTQAEHGSPRTAQRALELALKRSVTGLGYRCLVTWNRSQVGNFRCSGSVGKFPGQVAQSVLHFRETALLSLSRMHFSLSSFLGFCSGHQCDKLKTLLSRPCCSCLWPCDPVLEFSKWGFPFLPAWNLDTVIPPPVTWKPRSHVAAVRTEPHTEGGRADRRKEPGSLAKSLSCYTHSDCPPPFFLQDGAAVIDEHKHTLDWYKPLTAECPDTSGGRKEDRWEGRSMRRPAATKTKGCPEDGEQRGL